MSQSQPCILIVEPDIVTRQPLAEYLRECGYKVIEASDADEARQLLAGVKFTINVALVALDLSDESGFALGQWIGVMYPAIKVLLAGTVTRTVQVAGDLCEEEPPIAKPYDHQLVLDRIRRMRAARDRKRSD